MGVDLVREWKLSARSPKHGLMLLWCGKYYTRLLMDTCKVQNMKTLKKSKVGLKLFKIILGFIRKLVQGFAKASLKHVILRK